jgi:hypothetical protein
MKGEQRFADLWTQAKQGSGWTGKGKEDAFAIVIAGPKGIACIPNGDRGEIRKLADAFSVMAAAGSMDVKMIEIDEVEVYPTFGEDRFAITGGGLHVVANVKDNPLASKFFKHRASKGHPLRLVISLADFDR